MKDKQRCEKRIDEALSERLKDIEILARGDEKEIEKAELYDYGLGEDLVEANTFRGQKSPYRRWQLSWGGPSDEFRLYQDGTVEYWFLDWFDGASRSLTNGQAEIVKSAIGWDFIEPEMFEA